MTALGASFKLLCLNNSSCAVIPCSTRAAANCAACGNFKGRCIPASSSPCHGAAILSLDPDFPSPPSGTSLPQRSPFTPSWLGTGSTAPSGSKDNTFLLHKFKMGFRGDKRNARNSGKGKAFLQHDIELDVWFKLFFFPLNNLNLIFFTSVSLKTACAPPQCPNPWHYGSRYGL